MKSFIKLLLAVTFFPLIVSALEPNQQVLETAGDFSIQRVRFQDNHGNVQLANGRWYKLGELSPLVSRFRDLRKGQLVVERVGDRSVQRIRAISASGWFKLANGRWYRYGQLSPAR